MLAIVKDGSWTAVTATVGFLGLNKVKKMMRMMIVTKIKKMVATMHEARFVRPVGGGGGFFRPPIGVLSQGDGGCRDFCFLQELIISFYCLAQGSTTIITDRRWGKCQK